MCHALRERQLPEGILKPVAREQAQRFLRCKHRLILVCVKISTNDEPIYRRNFHSDHVIDMCHQSINGYFALSYVLRSLSFFVPMPTQIALQMQRVHSDIYILNLEPSERKAPGDLLLPQISTAPTKRRLH